MSPLIARLRNLKRLAISVLFLGASSGTQWALPASLSAAGRELHVALATADPIIAAGFVPLDFGCRLTAARVTVSVEYRYHGARALIVKARYRPVRGRDLVGRSRPLRPADDGRVSVVLSYGAKSGARLSMSRPGKCAAFVLFAGTG